MENAGEKKKWSASREAGELRRLAEERLRLKETAPTAAMPEADVRALVHELQVHQIELEMQNEELRCAEAAAQELKEEALHASLARYRKLFDEATEGIALADAVSGELLDCNRAFEQLSGYQPR